MVKLLSIIGNNILFNLSWFLWFFNDINNSFYKNRFNLVCVTPPVKKIVHVVNKKIDKQHPKQTTHPPPKKKPTQTKYVATDINELVKYTVVH